MTYFPLLVNETFVCFLQNFTCVYLTWSDWWCWSLGKRQWGGGDSWAANNEALFSARGRVDVAAAAGRQQGVALLCRGISVAVNMLCCVVFRGRFWELGLCLHEGRVISIACRWSVILVHGTCFLMQWRFKPSNV